MRGSSIPLGEYVAGKIYRGVVTGCNPAFLIDGETRAALLADNPEADEIIKPLVVGDDVRKWRIEERDRWLIYIPHGADVRPYAAVIKHLKPYRRRLECRATSQQWYELQQPQVAYARGYEAPKIMYPIIAKESRFAFDRHGSFLNDKVFCLPVDDLFLLAILNSAPVWDYLCNTCSVLGDANRGGRLELRAVYMSTVPVPQPQRKEREVIASLAEVCLKGRGMGCEGAELEIDERVERLYGLQKSPARRDGQGLDG
jgi:hypothetical protein